MHTAVYSVECLPFGEEAGRKGGESELNETTLGPRGRDSALPTEFRLLKYGSNRARHITEDGPVESDIEFSREDAIKVLAAFLDQGVDLQIDYDHSTVYGNPGEKIAAGWATLDVRDDGLYAVVKYWTAKAAGMLSNKEYRYYSPYIAFDENGAVAEMLPIALTNTPALKQINALMNNMVKDKPMSEQIDNKEAELLAKIEKLELANRDLKVNTMLDKAIGEGKLAPAKRAELFAQSAKLGIDGLKTVLSYLQPVITAPAKAPAADKAAEQKAELTKEEKAICDGLGYSYEAFSTAKRNPFQRASAEGAMSATGTVGVRKLTTKLTKRDMDRVLVYSANGNHVLKEKI